MSEEPHETAERIRTLEAQVAELTVDLEREIAISRHLGKFRRLLMDLTRNANGRHEGDLDVGDPTGFSQGNPHLRPGDVIGYTIGGRQIVVPIRSKHNDPDAWLGEERT